MASPKVFISSTFYDLKQIRTDISEFIENNLGYQFIRSEHSSFPVNPSHDTIENCKEQVKNCDIMVLIIGGRYGDIPEKEIKSVTNLEYLTAKSIHVPIFIFILNNVLTLYHVWENNPSNDFSKFVDSNKLFDFIKSIKKESKWIFPFDTAQEIISILRVQFANLMTRGIELVNKTIKQPAFVEKLYGNAFKLAIEKPVGWHGLLFAELITQEVEKRIEKRIFYSQGISFGIGEIVKDEIFKEWFLAKNDEAKRFIEGLDIIINNSLKDAFEAKDIAKLINSSKIIGNAYEEALEWSLRMRKCYVSDYFKDFMQESSLILEDSIEKIEILGNQIKETIEKAISTSTEDTIYLTMSVKIEIKNADEWHRKLNLIKGYLS